MNRRSRPACAGMLTTLAVVLTACGHGSPSLLDGHGHEARHIAGVWWLMFGLASGVYAVVAGLIFWAMLRGRRADPSRGGTLNENAFVVFGGVIVPVLILAVLAVVTITTTRTLRNPRPGALRVEVVGKRWWWEVRYPGTRVVTANEVHLPVGRPIELGLDSDNVIHSFWVPQLAGKVDLVPGQHNTLRFSIDRAGTYRGQCAEFCGLEHALMRFYVVAEPPGVFDRWLSRRARAPGTPPSDASANGEVVFQRETCAGCHTVSGTSARGIEGPDLTDVGSRRWLGAGTLPNTPRNLRAWIADSQAAKPGNLMPPSSLSARDLDAIVAYLESLKE